MLKNFANKKIDSSQQHYKMLHTPIHKLLYSMAIPTVISQLITVAYNTADTYFISQINTSASAAVGVVFSLMAIIQSFGFGIGMGANSLISRKLGEKNNEDAYKFANSALCAAIIVGLFLLITGLSNLKDLMCLLGSTNTMLTYSCSYAKFILLGAPVMCSSFVLNNILRGEGQAFFSMFGLCIGGILNIILDPIFIFKLNLGIGGAALATFISQCVSLIILLSIFIRKKSIIKLNIKYVSHKTADYILILKTGFPTICRQGMASISSALLNIKASVYGDAAIAAVTIANKIYMLVRNIIIGIGQGYQPIAGYNYGANNKKRVKEAFRFSCTVGTVICTACAIVIFVFAGPIIEWFRNDPDVIRIGTLTLYFGCAVMPFMAYSTYVNQTYQCLGYSLCATLLASCRQGIFFIPIVLLLPKLLGLTAVQAVQPLSDLLTFIISIPFQIAFFRHHLSN